MRIAVCICTMNRPRDLALALDAVLASTAPPAEVIVSDDSDPHEAERTRRACAERSSRVLYEPGPHAGLAANRNACLDRLSSDVDGVSFIDDDVVMSPTFLSRAGELLASAGRGVIISGMERRPGAIVKPSNLSFWGFQRIAPHGPSDVHAVVINATLFPRDVFDHVRFDAKLWYGHEEIDLCGAFEAAGYRVLYDDRLVNFHNRSPVNRDRYEEYLTFSRMYATYKRYRIYEQDRLKAEAFLLLDPLRECLARLRRRRSLRPHQIVAAALTARNAISSRRQATRPPRTRDCVVR